jgi:hypothetical protein
MNAVAHIFEASFNMADMLMSKHWIPHKTELIRWLQNLRPGKLLVFIF